MASKAVAAPRERIGRIGQRREVVIPREIFEKLKMREGDIVAFSRIGDSVLIKPRRLVEAEDELTPEEAKLVRRGEAQLKRGESKSWRDVKHALAR